MNAEALKIGEIVRLSPEVGNPMFAGCLMVVTETKSWGAQGYVQGLGKGGLPGGQAYFRAPWDQMERTGGVVEWAVGSAFTPEQP